MKALWVCFALLTALPSPLVLAASDAVDRAVQALGGAEALAGVRTLTAMGTAQHWEPGQSEVPSGEKRFAGNSTFTLTRDLAARSARTDWDRKLVYPRERTYQFSEIVVAGSGYVAGIDTTARTKQSLDSDPPQHTMSPFRAAAAARELARSSPLLALEMQRNPAQVARLADVQIGDVKHPAVRYAAGGYDFIALFDPSTGLPARIRTLDFDAIQGDASFDLVLSDWREVGGIQVAHRQVYELNGTVVVDTAYQSVELNGAVEPGRLEIPQAYRAEPLAANAKVPYQWVIRRQYAGTFFDADRVSYDSKTSKGIELLELAPGVQITQGGTHNSLIVEMKDHLVVFDAPVSDAQSQWTIRAAQAKFPGKPIRTLVMTHHHIDHSAGVRSYAALGASLVVGAGTAEHYRKLLAAPSTRNLDLAAAPLAATPITEVSDKLVLGDGEREVGVYFTANPHAQGMLIGYLPDAKLGYVTDLWSPGRDPLPEQSNPLLAAVVETVKKYELAPERFAGGHGSSAPYEPLAKLVGGGAGD